MSRLHEEPKQHVHDHLVGELNEMSIRLKLWKANPDENDKIREARKRHPSPTWDEILLLIDRCRDEMNQCTKPYKIHR